MAERQKRNREEQEEQEVNEKPAKKGGMMMKLVIALVLVLVLAGGGVGGWIFYQQWSEDKGQVEEETPQIGPLWSMGTLIVNLLDDEGDRYLKVAIELELSSPEMVEELDLLRPKILDGILDLLSTKHYREIVGFDGRQQLRDEIILRINNYLTRGSITKVYFTEFVIQ